MKAAASKSTRSHSTTVSLNTVRAIDAAGNAGTAELAPGVARYREDEDDMLAETAGWALARIEQRAR